VIDDEPLARQGMTMLIGNMPNLKLIDSFSNPLDAILTLQNQQIDLLFLDINEKPQKRSISNFYNGIPTIRLG
jgi:two-component system, LytTR family, response regulator